MTDEKKEGEEVTVYTETPETGINNGITITPSAGQEKRVENEAAQQLKENEKKLEKDAHHKNDTSGEDG